MVRALRKWLMGFAIVLLRPNRPGCIGLRLYTTFYAAHWRPSRKEGDLLKGQLVLPPAPQRVTSRELKFTVGGLGGVSYSVEVPADALLSDKFDVQDGDEIKGSLTDINKWGRSLPRLFTIQVEFPLDSQVPDQPGPVTLNLSLE